eukprot:TRINITY_DN1685_c0_g1_i3.p1 TRINITY_DN1685_c0_g1~~TRINITY_DN1685_c0_g1_i3.p1  ORF type:complete len:268 (+),score=56.84 TRINITY_DN1685_c0_g1_i3:220-1023(+)
MKSTCTPIVEKIVPLMFKPLLNSHVYSYSILKVLFNDLKKEAKDNKTSKYSDFKYDLRRTLWRIGYWSGEASIHLKIVEPELYPLEENLRKLGKVPPFSYLSPWKVRWEIQQGIEQLLKDAWYTIETDEGIKKEFESGTINLEESLTKLYPTLAKKYYHDSLMVVSETMKTILMDLILTPVTKAVDAAPGVKSSVEEIQKGIPETLQDFIDLPTDFEELIEGIVSDIVNEVVETNKSSLSELEDGFTRNAGAAIKEETPTEETEVIS